MWRRNAYRGMARGGTLRNVSCITTAAWFRLPGPPFFLNGMSTSHCVLNKPSPSCRMRILASVCPQDKVSNFFYIHKQHKLTYVNVGLPPLPAICNERCWFVAGSDSISQNASSDCKIASCGVVIALEIGHEEGEQREQDSNREWRGPCVHH